MAERYTSPPMTLGNMRSHGVRRLIAWCDNCQHQATLDVDAYPDEIPVPSFGPRLRCLRCGHRGAHARPDWREITAVGMAKTYQYPSLER